MGTPRQDGEVGLYLMAVGLQAGNTEDGEAVEGKAERYESQHANDTQARSHASHMLPLSHGKAQFTRACARHLLTRAGASASSRRTMQRLHCNSTGR